MVKLGELQAIQCCLLITRVLYSIGFLTLQRFDIPPTAQRESFNFCIRSSGFKKELILSLPE